MAARRPTCIKSVKRSMAGEYSRELSTKVFQGACRLIQLGFEQGGAAASVSGECLSTRQALPRGSSRLVNRKACRRTGLCWRPGLRRSRRLFVGSTPRSSIEQKTERQIADALNERKVLTDLGRPWTRGTIHQILTNGEVHREQRLSRTSFKLKRKHVLNPREMWIRADVRPSLPWSTPVSSPRFRN